VTQKEFLNNLRDLDLHFYERNGFPTGVVYDDMKFRFSRLGIEKEQFEGLPEDKTEEQKALDEIQAIRESRKIKDRDEIEFDLNEDDINDSCLNSKVYEIDW
jgi:hypothetical protein